MVFAPESNSCEDKNTKSSLVDSDSNSIQVDQGNQSCVIHQSTEGESKKPEVAQAIQSKESWRAIYSCKLKPISKNENNYRKMNGQNGGTTLSSSFGSRRKSEISCISSITNEKRKKRKY